MPCPLYWLCRSPSRFAFLGFLLLLLASPTAALEPDRQVTQYIHDTWPVTADLHSAGPIEIRALAQTGDGFLWLGTSAGLVQFDGVRFQSVDFEDVRFERTAEGHPDAWEIYSLLTDARGTLWIGHQLGLASLTPDDPSRQPQRHRIPSRQVLSLTQSGPDSLWLGTRRNGASKYTPQLDSLRESAAGDHSSAAEGVLEHSLLEPVSVPALVEDPRRQRLWLGTTNGLTEIDWSQPEPSVVRTWGLDDGLTTPQVQALCRGADGSLWIGTRTGLHRLLRENLEPIPEFAGTSVTAMYRDRSNDLWVGTEDQGVWLLRTGTWQQLPLPSRLDPTTSPRVSSFLQDSDGSLWIGTADAQLHQLKDGQYRSFGPSEGMSTIGARHVAEDRTSGDIWVTTNDARLNLIRRQKVVPLPPPLKRALEDPNNNQQLSALYQAPDGPLWMGTRDGVLWRYENGDLTSIQLPSTAYGEKAWAHTIAQDADGNLWVGTLQDGLFRLRPDGTGHQHFTIANTEHLPHNTIRVLFLDFYRRLWITTLDGVTYYRDGRFASPNDPLLERLPRFVHSFYEDSQHTLWMGTEGGLYWLHQGQVDYLDYSRGLYNDIIYAIAADEYGQLWFGTQAGIFYIQQPELKALMNGEQQTVTSIPLANQQEIECYGPRPNIGTAARDGSIYFATTSSLVQIDPAKVSPPAPPPIIIESIIADGEELPHQETILLYAGVRKLEIFFTSPYLKEPGRLIFSYRMQGLPQGATIATERKAVFTNLTPGDYRFDVWAEQLDGADTPITSWRLRIEPPYYQRPPVQALALLLLLVVGRGIYRLRLQQLLSRNQDLEDTIAERTAEVIEQREQLRLHNRQLAHANQELQHANEQLQDLNRQKADFLAIAAHDLRTPLVNLKGFASETGLLLGRLFEVAAPVLEEHAPHSREQLQELLHEEARESLEYIHSSTDRMDALIKGILMLSRLGRRQLQLESVDLQELARQVLGNLSYEVVRKKVRVNVGSLPSVTADLSAMEQTLENLLRNAVSYLDPSRTGEVDIRSERHADEVRVHIRDNGRGIAPNQRDKVFKIFGRAGRNDDVPGEGIGLASVRTLIERHGGRIWFESEVGVGTTFTFSLPDPPVRAVTS